jgi:hypothetical protein
MVAQPVRIITMMLGTRFSRRFKFSCGKLRPTLKAPLVPLAITILFVFFIFGCGVDSKGSSPSRQGDNFSAPLPKSFSSDSGITVTAQIIVDNSGAPIDLTVDQNNNTVSKQIDDLTEGPHSFTIHYYFNGVLVASVNTSATIIAGSTPTPVPVTSSMIKFSAESIAVTAKD